MVRVRCPTSADPTDEPGCDHRGDACTSVIGCGLVFDGEPDHEGLIDCECGIWFTIAEGTNALVVPVTIGVDPKECQKHRQIFPCWFCEQGRPAFTPEVQPKCLDPDGCSGLGHCLCDPPAKVVGKGCPHCHEPKLTRPDWCWRCGSSIKEGRGA